MTPTPPPSDAKAEAMMPKPDVLNDGDLGRRVAAVVEQRDKLLDLASEMLATLAQPRNAEFIHDRLRELVPMWRTALERALAHEQLTADEVSYALAAQGIDMEKSHTALKKLIAKHAPLPAAPAQPEQCPSLRESQSIWIDAQRRSGRPCLRGTRFPVSRLLAEIADDEAFIAATADNFYLDAGLVKGALKDVAAFYDARHAAAELASDHIVDANKMAAAPAEAGQACPADTVASASAAKRVRTLTTGSPMPSLRELAAKAELLNDPEWLKSNAERAEQLNEADRWLTSPAEHAPTTASPMPSGDGDIDQQLRNWRASDTSLSGRKIDLIDAVLSELAALREVVKAAQAYVDAANRYELQMRKMMRGQLAQNPMSIEREWNDLLAALAAADGERKEQA